MTILSKSSIVIESGIILTEKMRRKIQQEEERMRGVETRIQEIRHAIFTEVAKMAYDVDSPVEKTIEEIPYRVIPGEVGNFRNDVFLERAIVGELSLIHISKIPETGRGLKKRARAHGTDEDLRAQI